MIVNQNAENGYEVLRGRAITHTPVENTQLTLVWKTLKGVRK